MSGGSDVVPFLPFLKRKAPQPAQQPKQQAEEYDPLAVPVPKPRPQPTPPTRTKSSGSSKSNGSTSSAGSKPGKAQQPKPGGITQPPRAPTVSEEEKRRLKALQRLAAFTALDADATPEAKAAAQAAKQQALAAQRKEQEAQQRRLEVEKARQLRQQQQQQQQAAAKAPTLAPSPFKAALAAYGHRVQANGHAAAQPVVQAYHVQVDRVQSGSKASTSGRRVTFDAPAQQQRQAQLQQQQQQLQQRQQQQPQQQSQWRQQQQQRLAGAPQANGVQRQQQRQGPTVHGVNLDALSIKQREFILRKRMAREQALSGSRPQFRANPYAAYAAHAPANGVPRPHGKPKYEEDDDLEDFIDDDEDDDWRKELQMLTGYDPSRYNDELFDDRRMEAGWNEIQAEERRSARMARAEDEKEEEAERRHAAEKAAAKKRKRPKGAAAFVA